MAGKRGRRAKARTNKVLATRNTNAMGWQLQTTTPRWLDIKAAMDGEVVTPRFMRRELCGAAHAFVL